MHAGMFPVPRTASAAARAIQLPTAPYNHLGRSPVPRFSFLTRSQAESGSESLDFIAPASPLPRSAAETGRRRPAPLPSTPLALDRRI